jgi:hypothetical protein
VRFTLVPNALIINSRTPVVEGTMVDVSVVHPPSANTLSAAGRPFVPRWPAVTHSSGHHTAEWSRMSTHLHPSLLSHGRLGVPGAMRLHLLEPISLVLVLWQVNSWQLCHTPGKGRVSCSCDRSVVPVVVVVVVMRDKMTRCEIGQATEETQRP